jgi:hypothetical protein
MPSATVHRIRVELGTKDQNQAASVLLAYANPQMAPCTQAELSHAASLPDHPNH